MLLPAAILLSTQNYLEKYSDMSAYTIVEVTGTKIKPFLAEVAKLRMKIFREYPYFYEGDMEYERQYLERYVNSPDAILLVAQDENSRIIGASTGNSFAREVDEITLPFRENGWDLDEVYYFAESVLLQEWRGKGLGKEFMERRTAFAKKNPKIKYLAFCGIERGPEYPVPENYNSPEFLWQKQGFIRHPELVSQFSWKDVGGREETLHPLVYWVKEL